MSAETSIDDYWTQQIGTAETPPDAALHIETIEGVEPLDALFGAAEPRTVPDALFEPLFGQPYPTPAELEQAEGDPAQVPPLHTYAILDAAKVLGLPELLAVSGLEHRCFFKGDVYNELKDVAPWIVKLEEGNKFTRDLFTRSNAGWHLWDNDPGLYFRARGTLDEMWSHLRKITRIQDGRGKNYFFRFWEKSVPYALLIPTEENTHIDGYFWGIKTILYPHPQAETCVCIALPERKISRMREHSKTGLLKKLGVAFECGLLHPCYQCDDISHSLFVSQCWNLCDNVAFTEPALIQAICRSVLSLGQNETASMVTKLSIGPSRVAQRKAAFALNKRGNNI